MKRRLQALALVTTLTFGFLVFGFLGSATSVAMNGFGRAFGVGLDLVGPSSTTSLVAPLPSISVDKANPQAEQALVRIADQPAGPMSLIDEIAALYVTGKVDVDNEKAIATADTARVALLETPDVPASLPSLPGINLDNVLGLIGSLPKIAAIPTELTSPTILADALHGIVTLSCPQVESLRSKTSVERLQAITAGSLVQQLKIKGLLDTAVTPDVLANLNKLQDNEFDKVDGAKERASALSLRINLPALDALGIKEGTRLLEINVYEVNAENLRATNLKESTVRTSVDMLHVTVLDKILGIPEVDLRVGHAEAALVNCGGTSSVKGGSVIKLVDSIAGVTPTSQIGLTARPGDEIVYSLRILNSSTVTENCGLTHASDQLPTGFLYVSDSGGLGTGSFHSDTNKITWANFDLRPGQSATQTIRLRLSQSIPSGIYINTAEARGTCGTFSGSAPGIEVIGRITVDVLKTVESIAGKTTTSTSTLTAKAGDEVLYKLVVTNSSAESCSISQVVDQLPTGFGMLATTGQLGSGRYDAAAGTITWDGLEIASGETAEQGILVKISPTITPGLYRNTATATGSCGTFQGTSPAISVPGVLGGPPFTRDLPKTGVNDTLMWFGPLLLAAAAAGVSVLRRSR